MPTTAVTDATWDDEVLGRRGVVVVDLRAQWCSPCAGFSALVARVGDDHPTVTVRHLDVDADPATARRYGVTSLPTLLVFRDGALVRRLVGARQAEQLERELAGYLP